MSHCEILQVGKHSKLCWNAALEIDAAEIKFMKAVAKKGHVSWNVLSDKIRGESYLCDSTQSVTLNLLPFLTAPNPRTFI
mmetsp:Transcript_6355/g.10996  ORF Transcript_6355/g.10996 Transcript_6355/m.10996 type:complete len:80 (+) Transcript_6355:558-797(+)